MTETDAKDWNTAHHFANALLRVGYRLRITRPVRQKDAVGLERKHVFRAGHGRHDRHPAALTNQPAHDVVLDAVVVGDDVIFRRLILYTHDLGRLVRAHAFIPLIHVASADFLRQISAIHLGDGACLGNQLRGVGLQGRDDATHHSVVAEVPYQGARVNLGKHGNLIALQILLRDLLRTPVRADAREFAHNQAFDVGAGRFIVFGVGAVVADFGIGENYDLSGVGGVGKDFLVAGDGGVKNNFPVAFAFRAVAFAAED